jgi:hypothetical protein
VKSLLDYHHEIDAMGGRWIACADLSAAQILDHSHNIQPTIAPFRHYIVSLSLILFILRPRTGRRLVLLCEELLD